MTVSAKMRAARWPTGRTKLQPKTCVRCGCVYGPKSWEKPKSWLSRLHCSLLCAQKARAKTIAQILSEGGVRNPTTGCLEWKGPRDKKGYGRKSSIMTDEVLVHRISWINANGMAIPQGLHVLHHCDNPPCFEPEHLYVGTNDDNVRDRHERQRWASQKGEDNPRAKLTREDVVAIKYDDRRQADIAADYRVSQSTISGIKKGQTWSA